MDGSQKKTTKKTPLLRTILWHWLLWLLPVYLSWSDFVFVRKTGKQSHREWRSVQKDLWSGTSAADQWTEKQRDTDTTKKKGATLVCFMWHPQRAGPLVLQSETRVCPALNWNPKMISPSEWSFSDEQDDQHLLFCRLTALTAVIHTLKMHSHQAQFEQQILAIRQKMC